jgi:signal peptidase II
MTPRAALARLCAAAALALALDQGSKRLVLDGLDLADRYRIEVVPGLFTLKMGWNTGVNFGLLASDADFTRWFLIALAIAVSAVVAVWAIRRRSGAFVLGAGALIGGALGNAIDRALYGAVADFLNVTCCGLNNPYAFNVADVAIFLGALTLAFAPAPETRTEAPRRG